MSRQRTSRCENSIQTIQAEERIFKWLADVRGPFESPKSFTNLNFYEQSLITERTINHVDEVRERIGYLKLKRLETPGFASTFFDTKSNFFKDQEEKEFIEIVCDSENITEVARDFNYEKEIENNNSCLVEESTDTDLRTSLFRNVQIRRFYSFDSFESDINTIDTAYLDHVLWVYKKSIELRNKQKRFFRYFDLVFSILDSEKVNFIYHFTQKQQTVHKIRLLKSKFLIYKLQIVRYIFRNRTFRSIYSRFIKRYLNSDDCDNFYSFHRKEYYRFMQRHLTAHGIDVGYQFCLPDQLRFIFKWLREVKHNRHEFAPAPKSFTDLVNSTAKEEVELNPKTLTNREEMIIMLYDESDSKKDSNKAKVNNHFDEDTEHTIENMLIKSVAFPILSPLKTREIDENQIEQENSVESLSEKSESESNQTEEENETDDQN
jgi:hypothetical protein